MLKIIALIIVLWLSARFGYGVDFARPVDHLERLVELYARPLFGFALLACLALPGITYAFNTFGFYSLMYSLAKLCFWVSNILICLFATAAILLWFDLEVNLWALLGKTALLPLAMAGSAAFSLHLADFNYPVKEALTPLLGLTLFSLLLVSFYAFVIGS